MLKPVNKRIFVRPDIAPEKVGNIIMPPQPGDGRVSSGVVVASDSPLCEVGDVISYCRFWPTTFRGRDICVVDEKDLTGVDDSPAAYDAPADTPGILSPDRSIMH